MPVLYWGSRGIWAKTHHLSSRLGLSSQSRKAQVVARFKLEWPFIPSVGCGGHSLFCPVHAPTLNPKLGLASHIYDFLSLFLLDRTCHRYTNGPTTGMNTRKSTIQTSDHRLLGRLLGCLKNTITLATNSTTATNVSSIKT